MTEGLRARQGSMIREVGGSYKVRPPFLSIFHYPTKSLPPLANMPFETAPRLTQHPSLARVSTQGGCFQPPQTLPYVETRDGGFLHHHHPFGSCFDARGGVFDLPRPSLMLKREMGGFFNTTTPSARVST